MVITWQWVVNQFFAFIGLMFLIISFQQKTTYKLILLRNLATGFVFIGLCFLGNVSAIIMCGAGVIRNVVFLHFASSPSNRITKKYIAAILISLLVIFLNIIFWKDIYNLFSIVIGIANILTFVQEKPAAIRKYAVVAEILSVIYFTLLFTPVNIVIESVGLMSAIIGIIRLDIKKKES